MKKHFTKPIVILFRMAKYKSVIIKKLKCKHTNMIDFRHIGEYTACEITPEYHTINRVYKSYCCNCLRHYYTLPRKYRIKETETVTFKHFIQNGKCEVCGYRVE